MSLSHFLMNCFVDGCLPRFREELLPIEIWMGVELHLNEPVEQLEFVDRQIVGVTTNRRHYPTNSLVINSDFARTMQRLVPDHLRRKWSDRKLAATKFSYATFMMYLGVEGLYDLPHHTIHIASDYHRNLDEIENQHVLSADPSFYVQNVCVTDSTLARRVIALCIFLCLSRISTRMWTGRKRLRPSARTCLVLFLHKRQDAIDRVVLTDRTSLNKFCGDRLGNAKG